MEVAKSYLSTQPLLEIKDLSISVRLGKSEYIAVDNANFSVNAGEIVGIVGESGCGKSLTALSIMNLLNENVRVSSGEIIFEDKDLLKLSKKERRNIYGNEISMIFQEPMTSLNPLLKIGVQMEEPLKIHKKFLDKSREIIAEALSRVGLTETKRVLNAYPFEMSGGMQQRAMIAMSSVCGARLLIADEPTTALDVTTQAQVLELLKKLNREKGTSILFISHDIGVIRQLCDRVIVMYSGQIVESGRTQDILKNPLHCYTKALLASIPMRKKKGSLLECIDGKVPSITETRLPCQFAPRCKFSRQECFSKNPKAVFANETHKVNCFAAENELSNITGAKE